MTVPESNIPDEKILL